MSELKELLTAEDLEQVWEKSKERPVYLFKLSTTCPVSAKAFTEFESFLKSTKEDIEPFFVKVRETRDISDKIAEETEIRHHSPQVLLIKDKEVLWNASHTKITEESLEAAIQEA